MSRSFLIVHVLCLLIGATAQSLEYRPSELPEEYLVADNQILKMAIEPHIKSLPDYLNQKLQDFEFLCLGEYHSNSQRKIYGEIIKALNFDILAIEDQQEDLNQLIQKFQSGDSSDLKLLNADFRPILEAINWSAHELIGVETTARQDLAVSMERINTGRQRLSRDGFIALNIEPSLKASKSVVALYGAKHCAKFGIDFGFSVPFYRLLMDRFPEKRFSNLLLMDGSRGNSALSAYMKAFGFLKDGPVVISDLSQIDPKAYNYRGDIRQLFEAYEAIIISP